MTAAEPVTRLWGPRRPGAWRTFQSFNVCVHLLSFSARVSSNSPEILRQLLSLYPTASSSLCRSCAASALPFAVVEDSGEVRGLRYRLTPESGNGLSFGSTRDLIAHLEYLLNAAAAQSLGRNLLVHAGAVAGVSGAIVFPGASGQGKSTLVAALCLAGFQYLSDELTIVDHQSLAARPFLKPICLKDGGWRALTAASELPRSLRAVRTDGVRVRYLRAPRSCSPQGYFPVKHVLLPQRQKGATAELKPNSRARTLVELARHSLNLPRHGWRGLDVLARLVEGAECYVLTYDNAPQAVAAISTLN